ncbi:MULTISPECIES: RNA 2',3'-cyclic phosphodiesterase [unclassified Lebetimonas]|uniref:RNA 2',3'-cyclic phosphodiesterase n=1 Tax=unclassified Lebetimonas TaxID=2648158 RepID=UPI0004671C82|nr:MULTISPECIES: RNA 2',3'-cyclic phosphodiesterase [unclassified Lebetimonas]
MRLFIATPVNLPVYQTIKNDFKDVIDGKWVEGWNLHLTHKFIGEDEPEKYKIKLKMQNGKWKINGINLLKNKILYLQVEGNDSINREINKKFNLKNDKPFLAHITLCRIKNIKDKDKLKEKIQKWQHINFEFPLEVYLYKSTLTKKGPIYEKIYKY